MEPTPLTCPKCGASWRVVKAGKGPVTCPSCKNPLDGAAAKPTASSRPPTGPVAASPPPPADISDADDPGLRGGFAHRPPEPREPRRRGMHPLFILLLLLVLVPLAAFTLLAVVCAVVVARS